MATIYLTASEARTRLQNLTQWESAPALTSAEIDDLLVMARTYDQYGYWPSHTSYTATYTPDSVRLAAASGWDWKAGKVAAEFDAAVGAGTSFQRSQQFEMCRKQASRLRGGGIGSLQVAT